MLDRRTFLRRTSLALAGGLLVGDAALEAFERLTHRKVFALGNVKWMQSRLAPPGMMFYYNSIAVTNMRLGSIIAKVA